MKEQFKTLGHKEYKVIMRFNGEGTPEFWSSLFKTFATDFAHADLFSIDSDDAELLNRTFGRGSADIIMVRKVDILVKE